jgi:hypothetical protein
MWVDCQGRPHFECAFSYNSVPANPNFSSYYTARLTLGLKACIQAFQDGTACGICDDSHMPPIYTKGSITTWNLKDQTSQEAMQGATNTSGKERVCTNSIQAVRGIPVCKFYF